MSDAHFSQCVRLRQAAEFKAVFAAGKRQTDACFTVISLPKAEGPARLGMVVSRKVSKLAVQRNRIKRQIRESFRRQQDELPHVELVIMARYSAAKHDNQQLRDSLNQHWHRLSRQLNK